MNRKKRDFFDWMAEEEGVRRTGARLDSDVQILRRSDEIATKECVDDLRLRVAVYCHVVKDADQQKAIELLDRKYQAKIEAHSDLTYAGLYADVGPFRRDEERPEFNRMMQDAEAGRFDVLISRHIGDFVRSMEELERIFLRLKELRIPAYFERECICSLHTIEQHLKFEAQCKEDDKRRKNDVMRKSIEMGITQEAIQHVRHQT